MLLRGTFSQEDAFANDRRKKSRSFASHKITSGWKPSKI